MPAGKKRTSAGPGKQTTNAKRSRRKATRRKAPFRIDVAIEAQQKVLDRVGGFLEDAAEMTLQGVMSPVEWLKRSARMWRDLADDLIDVIERV